MIHVTLKKNQQDNLIKPKHFSRINNLIKRNCVNISDISSGSADPGVGKYGVAQSGEVIACRHVMGFNNTSFPDTCQTKRIWL